MSWCCSELHDIRIIRCLPPDASVFHISNLSKYFSVYVIAAFTHESFYNPLFIDLLSPSIPSVAGDNQNPT